MEQPMPYFVTWMKDGRVRKFAYPHVSLETALGFAVEVLQMEGTDVWVADERGEKVADRHAVAEYAEHTEEG
jgi:hypothetical protein